MRLARSKAYLHSGVEIRWKTAIPDEGTPAEATFRFPGGLADYLQDQLEGAPCLSARPFARRVGFAEKFGLPGSAEWAITWTPARDGFLHSYCNTVPTPEGGTHEAGFWAAILKGRAGLRRTGKEPPRRACDARGRRRRRRRADLGVHRRAPVRGPDQGPAVDRGGGAAGRGCGARSLRHLARAGHPRRRRDPRLRGAARPRSGCAAAPKRTPSARPRRRSCGCPASWSTATVAAREGTELFLVEGDSAGGSAKMARERATQALLPLRGKILNVLGAASAKMGGNAEIGDLCLALGVGMGIAVRAGRPALRQGHHHDRRRRRRRPHRGAADDVLLHPRCGR